MHRALDDAGELSFQHLKVLLMPGIFPESTAGGLVIRDGAGAPTSPPNVINAYPPMPAFLSTCLLTGLPSDCSARVEPQQINAIVSELVAFAECLNPAGTWNCATLKNICAAFASWSAANLTGIYTGDTPPPGPKASQLWWESDTGLLFIYYDDGNSRQWVQVFGSDVIVDGVSIQGDGDRSNPHRVGNIDCGAY